MQDSFATAMDRALHATRAGDPMAATRIIQRALAGEDPAEPAEETGRSARAFRTPRGFVEDAEILADAPPKTFARARSPRQSLKQVLSALRRGRDGALLRMRDTTRRPPPPIPEGARYENRSFSCLHGARDYRLYVPASLGATGKARGLVLMLHGCTQDPDDFASGTGMNAQAEERRFIIAYPHQTQAHNTMRCWNWFRPSDQGADAGEPALLAALARDLAAEFALGPDRIFCAGLSAGGAMAAILGETHPETFAAVGIHSGLPRGAAHDVVSAFAAMRGDMPLAPTGRLDGRVIIFHGTADTTVHPSNADALFAAAGVDTGTARPTREIAPGGRSYTRMAIGGDNGPARAELWRIEGAGHAWSGGTTAGSYTDPAGPDASEAMARFFLGHDNGDIK